MKNLILMFLLIGCSQKEKPDLREPQGEFLLGEGFEMSPVNFNGEKLLLVFEREPRLSDIRQRKVVFYERETMNVVHEFDYDLAFSSALVHNGELYIFGATKNGRQIKVYKTSDMNSFDDLGAVFEVPAGTVLYNTSVIYDGTQFVMAYETTKPVAFSSHVAIANTIEEGFETIGGAIRPEQYTACPLIRKEGAFYYVLYLSVDWSDGFQLVTKISRSTDLITWERGPEVFRAGYRDGYNFSDVDLIVDDDGNFEVYYMNGDQQTWMNLERLVYEGNFQDMWEGN